MRLRLVIALLAAGLMTLGPSPALAGAKDAVIAHDTLIRGIWALDGDLVYVRVGRTVPRRQWMVRFKGHLHPAHGVPSGTGGGGLGLDAKGRKVLTFSSQKRSKDGYLVASKWFSYDLARDRARPLSGLPATSCPIDWLSIWRDATAYSTSCKDPSNDELFVRQGNETRRLPLGPGFGGLVFRDGTVAGFFEDGNDDVEVMQIARGGQSCMKTIPGSVGDATSETGWFPTGQLQIVNGYIAWTMGDPFWRSDYKLLAAKIGSGCTTPGPLGVFPFNPGRTHVQAIAVDDRRVFYADAKTLRRHVVGARPSSARPANDDFKRARLLSGDLPLSATGTTAFATVEPGEPLADTGHTVWYAFRAKVTRRTYVTVDPSCSYEPPDACGGAFRYGVYTGSSPDALTELPKTHQGTAAPYYSYTRIDAVRGHTYWIAVGSSSDSNNEPFTVRVDRTHP